MNSQENLIQKDNLDKHDIQRYEFKSMANLPLKVSTSSSGVSLETPTQKELLEKKVVENDLIDCLLRKTDELSSHLVKLQMQFEKAQEESKSLIENAKNDGYKIGFKEGEEKARNELVNSVNDEKNQLLHAITSLHEKMKSSQEHLSALEKELSAIAIDIAKEVIVKEVEENSQKVALALAEELLKNVIDATNIHLRVNPLDYPYLNEHLQNASKIKLESNDAIAKGGIVIDSSNGSIDGNLMNRYKTLKESVLDNFKV
ncbi:flagellar assembly protein FliH [Helicobacter cetorum]|uniref:Flagellar assembly protein FliH n=1 Tax=Helicobacter cetorum (strain ATCC BAA-540 / CCUG 52418 / MIT 99-5656) TaxID=1163745 RepID=I0ER69_HELCM|nr:flagellar assembly protein FliH [Helicobacter cetorum]AFI05438.1 flagellar assembly protein H [Helicobacter cetorum MIT 99-5656]